MFYRRNEVKLRRAVVTANFFVCLFNLLIFGCITKHIMSDPEGNSKFCFSSSLDVSLDSASGNIETRGKTKLTVSLGTRH